MENQEGNRKTPGYSGEDLFNTYFKVIPDLFFLMDAQGFIRDYRAQKDSKLYAPPEMFLGKRAADVLPPNVSRLLEKYAGQALREPGIQRFEYDIETPAGLQHFECRMSRMAETELLLAVVRDITLEHKAAQELIASEARFRNLLENAPYIIFIADLKRGLLTYCNQRAKAKFTCSAINYSLKTFGHIFTSPKEWKEILRTLRKDGAIFERETTMVDGDGTVFWAVLSASVVEYQNEPAAMISLRDITMRKTTEHELETEKIKLAERIKEQNCLQNVLAITGDYTSSMKEMLQKLVGVIGQGWMYPDIAEVQIEFDGKKYQTRGFRGTPWSMTAESRSLSGETVKLTVAYLEERPEEDEGPFLKEERTLLDNTAKRITGMVDHNGFIESIREHEQLMRIMFEHIAESITLIDPQTAEMILFNDHAAASLGYTKEEFAKLRIMDIEAYEKEDTILKYLGKASRGSPVSFETEHRQKDGETQVVEVSLTPLTYGGRALICETSRDITAEKKRALQKQVLADNLKLYNRLLGEIVGMEAGINGDIDQFVKDIATLLGAELSAERVSVWRLSEDQTKLSSIDYYIAETKTHPEVGPLDLTEFPVFDLIFRSTRYAVINQNFDDPLVRNLADYYRKIRGTQSFLQCGIISAGRPVGVFTVSYQKQAHEWQPDETAFFRQVADQIGMAFLNQSRIDAVKALEESEAFLNRAQKVAKTGHWRYNYDTDCLTWSNETYRMFGVPVGTPLDFTLFMNCVHPDDRERVAQQYAAARETRSPFELLHRIVVGGEIFWVNEIVEFDQDPKNSLVSMGTVQDITEAYQNFLELENHRNHLEELVALRTKELQKAKLQADNASQAKSLFLSNMSHEIRTPMNAVVGYAHLVKADPLTPKQTEQLDKLTDAAQNLLVIINDILDFSKIEANKVSLDIQDFEPARVIDRTCAIVSDLVSRKNLNMLVDMGNIPPMLRGDGSRFGQILLNLVSNAVKFTEKGGVTIKGRVTDKTETCTTLRFDIIDTGIGIDSADIPRLFNAFEQADDSTTRRYGGTGLGLAISKQLTALMGGRIGVTSEVGKGSTFFVEIPFENTAKLPMSVAHLEALEGKKIIVIDDSREAREIMTEMLLRFGLSVDTAASGKEGLEKLKKSCDEGDSYKFMVVDYRMPDMNGVETVRRMKAMNLPQPPEIIMVTAYSADVSSEDIMAAGISALLEKPVTPSRLNDTLTELLGIEKWKKSLKKTKPYEEEIKRRLGAHVLLVEDNPINQDVTVELLKTVGIHSTIAENGKIAVQMVRETAFDLILMDIQMPVMDGLQTTRAIRKIRGMEATPIIAMTANAFEEDRLRCIEAGMNDHVAKPVKPENLFSTIIKWLPESAQLSEAPSVPDADLENPAPGVAPAVMSVLEGVKRLAGVDIEVGMQALRGDRAPDMSVCSGNSRMVMAATPGGCRQQLESGDWGCPVPHGACIEGGRRDLRGCENSKAFGKTGAAGTGKRGPCTDAKRRCGFVGGAEPFDAGFGFGAR